MDGETRLVKPSLVDETVRSVVGGGTLVIGQDQDGVGVGFEGLESFSGYLSQLVLMNETLDEESMKEWTTQLDCQFEESALVSFDRNDSTFQSVNVSKYQEPNERTFFKSMYPVFHAFDRNLAFHNAKLLCNGLGGYIVIPRNENENMNLYKLTSNSTTMCQYVKTNPNIWLGVTMKNDTVVEYVTEEKLKFSYIQGEGSSIKSQRLCFSFFGCVSQSPYWDRRWMHTNCHDKMKTVCQFDHFSLLTIRGVCAISPLDTKYYIDEPVLKPVLKGFTHSSVKYEDYGNGSSMWRIYYQNQIFAELDGGELKYGYPVGKNTWHFRTDDCDNKDKPTELLITSCGLGQFTCSDGTCINVTKKCDYEIDCDDETDEKNCDILIMPENKLLSILPPPKLESQSRFEVTIHVNVRRIIQLNLESSTMKTDISIQFFWKDSRIKFANLRPVITANNVDQDQSSKLWLPSYSIQGHNLSFSTRSERASFLRVRLDAKPVEDDISRVSEGENFDVRN